MPRRPLISEIARARLLDVDVDRKKRIDDAIDYFGAEPIDVARDPCGELLLDGDRCSLSATYRTRATHRRKGDQGPIVTPAALH